MVDLYSNIVCNKDSELDLIFKIDPYNKYRILKLLDEFDNIYKHKNPNKFDLANSLIAYTDAIHVNFNTALYLQSLFSYFLTIPLKFDDDVNKYEFFSSYGVLSIALERFIIQINNYILNKLNIL